MLRTAVLRESRSQPDLRCYLIDPIFEELEVRDASINVVGRLL